MAAKPKSQRTLLKEMREQLELIGGKLAGGDRISRDGPVLNVPMNLTIREAANILDDLDEEESREFTTQRVFPYRPWDGAYCATNVLREKFGTVMQTGGRVETMFGPMDTPPQLIDVACDFEQTVSVLWGGVRVPGVGDTVFYFGSTKEPERGQCFIIRAEGPYRDRHAIQGIFELVEEELRENSLYKGKAFDGAEMPNFLDLNEVEIPIFSDAITRDIEANILLPLKACDTVEELNVKLKAAIVLYGYWGVGKTMVLRMAARVAKDNGWTFILVRPGRDSLEEALQTARMYEPAVVACEDIDTITGADLESDQISKVLDMFDGLRTKTSRVMLLLTTNHVMRIQEGVRRPGRIDTFLEIPKPDATAIQRMVEAFVPEGALADDIDWKAVTSSMHEYIPAFVREAVNKAIRYALVRERELNDENEDPEILLTTADLVNAGNVLKPHVELVDSGVESLPVPALDESLRKLVDSTLTEVMEDSFGWERN